MLPICEVIMSTQDDKLSQSMAYLEASLALCRTRPELHVHQIAAYQRYLDMATGASNSKEYEAMVKADGNMFEVNRAMTLDRYSNAVRLHRALGDDRALRAALICLQSGRDASGHEDLSARVTAALAEAEPLWQAARITTSQIRDLFVHLLDWALQANPARKASNLASLRHAWEQILAQDPYCSFQKLCEYPPYRRRIPFSDDRLARLGAWFKEAIG